MHPIAEAITTILLAIIGVAILALIVSPKATTSSVIQAGSSGFVNALATAESPVTGSQVSINTSYPAVNSSSFSLGSWN